MASKMMLTIVTKMLRKEPLKWWFKTRFLTNTRYIPSIAALPSRPGAFQSGRPFSRTSTVQRRKITKTSPSRWKTPLAIATVVLCVLSHRTALCATGHDVLPNHPATGYKHRSVVFPARSPSYPPRYPFPTSSWVGLAYAGKTRAHPGSSPETMRYPIDPRTDPGGGGGGRGGGEGGTGTMPYPTNPAGDAGGTLSYPRATPQDRIGGYPAVGYPIQTSPNDVLRMGPWEAPLWDHALDPNVCRSLRGLTKAQREVCQERTDVAGAAAIGLAMAVREVRRQLEWRRWDGSALATTSTNPHTAPIMARGYSESAFGHAMTSAGVTHSVARACAAGRLASCTCGEVKGKRAWKWSGCHDNTKYGARFSRHFLDVREKSKDLLSYTNLYNNEVGRKVVRRNRDVQCKCHGMSGSCEMRTCWKAAPDFKKVGDILLSKYERAHPAASLLMGNAVSSYRRFRPIRRRITVDSPLLYVEKSPPFCERDDRLDFEGTKGRICNRTSTDADSCVSLCCGRGYDLKRRKVVRKCNCRFKWCCKVTCQDCSREEWISVCK
ncbi:protein Wnt-4-like [Oratosquilla oratoria]|uniref:protein Wnt-4-like n=1 Tax=Oratosquilla oratoria TaxID=337810 RepID=UPI003F758709